MVECKDKLHFRMIGLLHYLNKYVFFAFFFVILFQLIDLVIDLSNNCLSRWFPFLTSRACCAACGNLKAAFLVAVVSNSIIEVKFFTFSFIVKNISSCIYHCEKFNAFIKKSFIEDEHVI